MPQGIGALQNRENTAPSKEWHALIAHPLSSSPPPLRTTLSGPLRPAPRRAPESAPRSRPRRGPPQDTTALERDRPERRGRRGRRGDMCGRACGRAHEVRRAGPVTPRGVDHTLAFVAAPPPSVRDVSGSCASAGVRSSPSPLPPPVFKSLLTETLPGMKHLNASGVSQQEIALVLTTFWGS